MLHINKEQQLYMQKAGKTKVKTRSAHQGMEPYRGDKDLRDCISQPNTSMHVVRPVIVASMQCACLPPSFHQFSLHVPQ